MKKIKGILRAISCLPLLKKVYVENCKRIDNQLLDKAISFQRPISIYCKNTNVQPDKFMVEHVDTKTYETDDNHGVKYVYQKIAFWF